MFSRISLIIAVVATVSLFSCNQKNSTNTTPGNLPEKPNIIYIVADDLGYGDLSFTGQEKFNTPNIDKLAKEGMFFTDHYSGSTVCAPSRSALMTGLHTGHTPIRGNKEVMPEGQSPLPDSYVTVAEKLKEAGYVTGAFGKWGLGFPGSEGDPNNQGFDEFFGYNCQRMAHNYYPYYLWHNQEKVVLEGNANDENVDYGPSIIRNNALKFIEDNKDNTFFLFYPTVIPHAELFAPEEYMQKFRGKLDPEVSYKGTDKGEEGFRKGRYGSQPEAHAAFAAMVTILDEHVGEVMYKLKELGIDDNTIVMFTSDNGPHKEGGADPDFFNSNGIFKGYKRDLYEGGIRVPMIARWPGKIKAGSTTDHISAFWDIMPTFADLAGFEPTENLDGISFLPTLTGEGNQENHEYLYWEFHERGGRIAVRKGKWKGIKLNVKKEPDAPMELYDLSVDPSEENNVAEEHPEIVKELTEIMENARTPSDIFVF